MALPPIYREKLESTEIVIITQAWSEKLADRILVVPFQTLWTFQWLGEEFMWDKQKLFCNADFFPCIGFIQLYGAYPLSLFYPYPLFVHV